MSDNDKAMVACTTVGFRSMADGTIRFTVDVEPLNSETALKAFSKPGTPCVLAVLGNDVAKKEMVADEAKKAGRCLQAIEYHGKHGKWPSNTADAMCNQDNFAKYLSFLLEETTVIYEYHVCDRRLKEQLHISSKTEIDTNELVFQLFEDMLADYREFVQDQS